MTFPQTVFGRGFVELTSAQSPAGKSSAERTVVERKVLPDGSIEIHYSDGTVKRIPREADSKAPAGNEEQTTLHSTDSGSEEIVPSAPSKEVVDEATKQAYLTSMKEYYSYRIHGFHHRQRVFEWQLVSSKIIFVVVMLLVSAGIYFAAVQFHTALRRGPQPGDGKEAAVTTFSAGTEGFKVSSPVLGVIILVISLAFFYFYLVFVYPIRSVI